MDPIKHYDERDIMALDDAGDYYLQHVSAMTAEGLHRKSEIAAELGYRDMVIAKLRAELAEARANSVLPDRMRDDFKSDIAESGRERQLLRDNGRINDALAAEHAEVMRIRAELAESRADFDALQKALVGDSGLSAILSAEKCRADSLLLDRVRDAVTIRRGFRGITARGDSNYVYEGDDSALSALAERLTK